MLADMFQASFRSSKLPSDSLMAQVMPVHKKGGPLDVSNHRPILLTCTACEIMEHKIRKQLQEHLDDNNRISQNQLEFCRHRWTGRTKTSAGRNCLTAVRNNKAVSEFTERARPGWRSGIIFSKSIRKGFTRCWWWCESSMFEPVGVLELCVRWSKQSAQACVDSPSRNLINNEGHIAAFCITR